MTTFVFFMFTVFLSRAEDKHINCKTQSVCGKLLCPIDNTPSWVWLLGDSQ